MRVILSSPAALGSLVAALSLVSCSAGYRPVQLETSHPDDIDAERRPPGVVERQETRLPEPRSRGEAEDSLVVLRSPSSISAARATLRRFFEAVLNEDQQRLEQILSEDAAVSSGTLGRSQRATRFWMTRFGKLEYQTLAGQLIYRDAETQYYTAEDLERLKDRRDLHLAPRPGELLMVTTILATGSGRGRKFGGEIEFLLVPTADGYRIRQMFEDFRLP